MTFPTSLMASTLQKNGPRGLELTMVESIGKTFSPFENVPWNSALPGFAFLTDLALRKLQAFQRKAIRLRFYISI